MNHNELREQCSRSNMIKPATSCIISKDNFTKLYGDTIGRE